MNIGISDIVKRFGPLEAVSHVSLDIQDGELFTLLGPSGCGKTTLLRLIAGFYHPDHGELYFGGRTMSHVPTSERKIGMVFQNYALWPHMTVLENVAYGLKIKKMPAAKIADNVERVLHLVNLTGLEKRYPGQLSGGQQQRVALARALVLDPDVLLLDEPLSNLDAKIRVQVRAEIRKLQRELKITTIYVTHDQEEALTLSDRMVVMNFGKIQQVGEPLELYERPTNVFVADFLGTNNLLEARVLEVQPAGEVLYETSLGLLRGFAENHLRPGAACTVTVRPETCDIDTEPPLDEQRNCLEGEVSFTYYCGNSVRYDVEMKNSYLFKADCHDPRKHRPIAVGKRVYVSFPAAITYAIPRNEEKGGAL